MGSQTVRHNLVTKQHNVIKDHIYFSMIYKGLHTLPSALLSSLCLTSGIPCTHVLCLICGPPVRYMPLDLLSQESVQSSIKTQKWSDSSFVKSSQSFGLQSIRFFFFYDKQHRIPAALVLVGNLKNNKKNNIKLTFYSVTVVCQKTIPGWVFHYH